MCRCTPNIRTPWCGKGDCVPPDTRREGARELPPTWAPFRLGIDPPASSIPAPTFDDMRKRIIAGSRDSALINSCYRAAEALGLSGEDRYVMLAFYALIELERRHQDSLQLYTARPIAHLVVPGSAERSARAREFASRIRACMGGDGVVSDATLKKWAEEVEALV